MTAGEFLINDVTLSVIAALVIAQLFKILTFSHRKGKILWKAALSGGGMPSSHSSVVTALAVGIGIVEGVYSPLFLVTAVITLIIIYQVLVEKKVANIFVEVLGEKNPEKQLIDQLGHSMLEILVGIMIGLLVVAFFYRY